MKRRRTIRHEGADLIRFFMEIPAWAFGLCFGVAFLSCHAAEEPAAAMTLPTIQVANAAVKLDHWFVIGPFVRSGDKQPLSEDFLRKMVADEPTGTASKFNLKQWLAAGQTFGSKTPGTASPAASLPPGDAAASMITWLQHSASPLPSGTVDPKAPGREKNRLPTVITGGRDIINLPYALGLGGQAAAVTGDMTGLGTSAAAGLYYCACLVHSDEPEVVYLMLSCDSPFVYSLNGSRVSAYDKSKVLRLWDYSHPLHLTTGDNLLLLRVDTREGDAGVFTAYLEPTKEAATRLALDNDGLTLPTVVLTAGQPLPIRVRGAPSHDLLQAEIVSFDDVHIANAGLVGNQTKEWNSAGVGPGLYKVRIRYDGASFEKPFYIMKPEARKLQDLMSGLDLSHLNEEQRIDLMALQTRMEILCRSENWNSTDTEWQRKIVFTLGEIKSITNRIKEGREPIKGVPGLHLRGFISAIDGQTEHYRIFVPRGNQASQAGGLPIVLIMPTDMSATRPFIESAFVAHQIEAETLADLAEKKGCAVLWVGFRCQPSGSPCDFAHFDEVLNAVKQDYHIDDQRIYLTGECGGGTLALMYNVEWPGRFAATGVINSLFHSFKIRHAKSDIFWSVPAYQRWLNENDPVVPVIQSIRPSLLVLHDGTADEGHGELRYSQAFAAQAKAAGYQFTFSQLPPTLHYHLEAWANMLDWMLPQRLGDPPKKAQVVSAPGHLQSISSAFAGPFILVEGTGGSTRDQLGMKSLCQSFQDAWRKTHFGPCRVVKDHDLSVSEKATNNLILLGNALTNCIWRESESRIPAKIASDGILIGAKKWSEPALSVQALLPNPYNPARLAVVIGGSDLAAVRFGTMDLSIEGWYDFSIWRARAGASELVDADRYPDAPNSQGAGRSELGMREPEPATGPDAMQAHSIQ
jgi:hypothetical protein